MSTENRFGIDGKAWYGAAGSSPATPLSEAAKISLKLSKQTGEFPSRATSWQITDTACKDAELEITIKNSKRNATAIAAFFNAWANDTLVAVKVLDAETVSRGIDADWTVVDCNNDQDHASPQEWVFSLKPSYQTGGRYPQIVTA